MQIKRVEIINNNSTPFVTTKNKSMINYDTKVITFFIITNN